MWCNHVSLEAKRAVASGEALDSAFMCWNITRVSQIYSSNKPPKMMKIGQILVRKWESKKIYFTSIEHV